MQKEQAEKNQIILMLLPLQTTADQSNTADLNGQNTSSAGQSSAEALLTNHHLIQVYCTRTTS